MKKNDEMKALKYFMLGIILLQLTACNEDVCTIDCVPFKKALSEKWGLMAADGSVVMGGRYDTCPTAVVHGRYAVQNKDGYWQLHEFPSGKMVSKRAFRAIGYFKDDVTLAVEKDRIEVVDPNGNVVKVLSDNIVKAHNFCEGKALVILKNGNYGFIDTQGNLEPYFYDYASDFSDGVAVVGNGNGQHDMQYRTVDGNWQTVAVIDVSGIRILEHYHDGKLLYVNNATGSYGLMDKKGHRLTTDDGAEKELKEIDASQRRWTDDVYVGRAGDAYMLTDRTGKALTNDRYAAIAFDGYMNGTLVQSFTAELPKDVVPPNPKGRCEADSAARSMNDTLQGKRKMIVSRLNQALKCLEANVREASVDPTDPAFRKVINDYVECVRAAYEDKNIGFLQQVFSNDALIITGRVVKSGNTMTGYLPHNEVQYDVQSKKEYLQKLAKVFRDNRAIRLAFSQIKIVRHPTKEGFYGVTLRQGYRSTRYSDDGYLFMLWDFRNANMPQIHVRTWQPTMTDSRHPLTEKDIYKIGDFTLE